MTAQFQQMSHSALFALLQELQDEPRTRGAAVEAERLLQELEVHQIELELQNRELREAQQLLEESRSRYADLFDLAPIGYCTFGEDGAIKEVNLTAAGMLGVARERLGVESFAGRLQPTDRERFSKHLRDCFEQGRAVTTELTLRITESGPLMVQMASSPVFGLAGRVVATRTTLTDISALKQSEQVLRFLVDASEILAAGLEYEGALTRVVGRTVPAFADVCMLDVLEEDGRVRRVHVAVADPERQALGHALAEVSDPAPDGSMHAQVLRSGAPLLIVDRSAASLTTAVLGELGPARSVMFIPLALRGQTLGVLTLVMTRSARVYSHRELTLALELARRAALAIDNGRAYRAAQRAAQTRDEVLAVVAHDLRSPLSAISLGASSLLSRPAPDDRRSGRRQLESMRRSAERMARLISDLVDVTSLEAGHLAIEVREHAVGELLADCAALLLPSAQIKEVNFSVAPCPAQLRVSCDRGRMLQVLGNLGDNAIKFARRGQSVVLSARASDEMIAFSMADTGPGIPPEALPRVFDRYWQVPSGTRKGSGLGLYIAKRIVEAQGGTIAVESTLGAGTTFHVRLPSSAGAPHRAPPDERSRAQPEKTRDALTRRVILVVDDDAEVRETLAAVLERKGYAVAQAGHGREAINYLTRAKDAVDLILLDLQMPEMDGATLLRWLKDSDRFAPIPVVLVSSQPDLRDVAQALGAVAYLKKPLEVEPLLHSVESHHA
jgi:PAS domain S-box-containing protein